jgi:hypothetical protein
MSQPKIQIGFKKTTVTAAVTATATTKVAIGYKTAKNAPVEAPVQEPAQAPSEFKEKTFKIIISYEPEWTFLITVKKNQIDLKLNGATQGLEVPILSPKEMDLGERQIYNHWKKKGYPEQYCVFKASFTHISYSCDENKEYMGGFHQEVVDYILVRSLDPQKPVGDYRLSADGTNTISLEGQNKSLKLLINDYFNFDVDFTPIIDKLHN